MKLRYKIGLAALVLGALVFAGTEVDQGKPGRYGSWPVSITGAVVLTGSVVTIDGGNVVVSGNVLVDGGSITPTPSSAATLVSSNAPGLGANVTPCTAPGGASCTNIIGGSGGLNLLGYQNFTITITNTDAGALSNGLVEFSADGTNWELYNSTVFSALPAGTTTSLAFAGNSRRFCRVEGRSLAGTTVQATITANSQAY